MAFGKYRYSNIKGEKGNDWNIEIWKDGFTGTATDFNMQGEGFEITWNGSGGDRSPTFLGSDCNINLYVQNNVDEAFVYDTLASGFQSYYVRIYKGVVSDANLWWYGWVQPGFDVIENTPYPYVYKLVATDSIGYMNQLKPFSFANESDRHNSSSFTSELLNTFTELSYTGLKIGGSTTDNSCPAPDNYKWLRTSADWWRDGDESLYDTVNPLSYYGISKGAYTNKPKYDDDNNLIPDASFLDFKVQDVIKGISRLFGLRGFLAEGRYNFIQPNLQIDNQDSTLKTYNYSGFLQGVAEEIISTELVVNNDTNVVLGGSSFTYEPPLESVSITHSQGASIINISPETNIESSTTTIGYLAADTGIHTMKYIVHNNIGVLKNDFNFNTNHDVFSNTYRNSSVLTLSLTDGNNTYYLQSNGSNQLQWELSNSTPLILNLERGYWVSTSDAINNPDIMNTLDVSNNADWNEYDIWPCHRVQSVENSVFKYRFRTLIRFIAEVQSPPISGIVTIGTSTSNNYYQRTIGQASIIDQINNPTPQYNTTEIIDFEFSPSEENITQESSSEIVYRASQTQVKAFDTKDLGSLPIAQRMTGEDDFSQSSDKLYSIQYLVGNDFVPATEGFRKFNSGVYTPILKLVAKEYLTRQIEPLQILQADIQSPFISPLKILKYSLNNDDNFSYYQFLGGTFKAQSEIMSGEWYKLGVENNTGVTVSGTSNQVFSLNPETNFEETTTSSLSSITSNNTKYINLDDYGVIDTEILAGVTIDKFQIDGVTSSAVYKNQNLRLSYPDGTNSVIVTSSSEVAKGSATILIDDYISDINFPVGSFISALKSDLTNVKAENVLDFRTAHYHSATTGSGRFIPLSGASVASSSSLDSNDYQLMFTVPYNGFVKSIVSYNSNTSSRTSDLLFYKNGDGTTSVGSSLTTPTYTTKFEVDCPSDWVFTKGDTISISRLDRSQIQNTSMTIVLQYNTQPIILP